MEEWKDIPGYEKLYQASTEGRIRTCEGKTTKSARFERRVWKQRILKPKYESRKGSKLLDARVTLWKDGKEKTCLVSRLVALTWCEGYADGLTVNHMDGDPLNNCCTNLEWVTLSENIKHGFKTGLYSSTCKAVTLIDQNGKKIHFASMAQASKYLGKNAQYISTKKAKGTSVLCNGYKLEVAS